jgi:two-component system, NtrC family, sensor histidine kinase PilS
MARTERMLRWLYTGRLIMATAIFIAAVTQWLGPATSQLETLIATVALLSALAMTAFGLWWVEILGRVPGRLFLHCQVVFDVLLVTAIVHVTGGPVSPYPPLYILVITAAALLLPLPGGLLIGALASLLFLADSVLLPDAGPTAIEFMRVGLFAVVAVAAALVGDRLRRAGVELGAAESALRQLRLDTNELLAAIDTALVTVDGTGRLMHVNGAASDLLRLPLHEWTGRPVLDELDRSAAGLGTLIRRTAATRVPVGRFEIRVPGTAQERERYLGARTTVVERHDMPWVTAVIQDITETKQIEELIRRADRLQAVAELGASLAHEIRNPLASIRSAVEQLTGDRLNADDRGMLRRLVVTESERLSRLLSEFMEFSRMEMRRWSKVDLAAVAMEAIELVTHHPDRGEQTRIDFCKPAAPLLIDGDRDLLHRAVFNLVLNAVQHTGPAGVVTVELDRPIPGFDVPPGLAEPGAAAGVTPAGMDVPVPVRVRVRDTGPGVRQEDIPRVFDPFFSRRSGGNGLGLAMVHRAVEAHRGAILVDSVREGGACFTIYLPVEAGGEHGNGSEAE